jgi:hypothetical protein
MKKLTWLVVLVGVVGIAACGGSGGGGSSQAAKDAAEAAAEAFGTLFDSADLQPCFNTPPQQCNCPGGGTVSTTVSATTTLTATFNNCKTTSGKIYTGTVTGDQAGTELSVNMSVFGDCTNTTGSGPGPGSTQCGGSVSGLCLGEQVSCSWSEVQQQGGEMSCDISC